jgi:hypothetical protein
MLVSKNAANVLGTWLSAKHVAIRGARMQTITTLLAQVVMSPVNLAALTSN